MNFIVLEKDSLFFLFKHKKYYPFTFYFLLIFIQFAISKKIPANILLMNLGANLKRKICINIFVISIINTININTATNLICITINKDRNMLGYNVTIISQYMFGS